MARILGDGTRRRTQAFSHLQSHYLFRDRFGRPGKHLLLARIEKRPARLDLTRYPHLPQPFVAATRSADYTTLLAGGAGHG